MKTRAKDNSKAVGFSLFPGSACLVFSCLATTTLALDLPKGDVQGGVKLGYSLGQNGSPWPKSEPFKNNNRGGFYVEQARVRAQLPYDSTLKLVVQVNAVYWELADLYAEMRWGSYLWKLGRFAGAGLRTGTGTDEFDLVAVRQPRYARVWAFTKRLPGWRDYGAQVERGYRSGLFTHRLFLHNASAQNLVNDEPNLYAGAATQLLGMDYSWEWKTTDHSVLGGHFGAMANKEWDEFLGHRDFWQAGYWFKTNSVVDGSLFHEFETGRAWFQSEFLAMSNRNLRNPLDSSFVKTWGVSVLGRYRLGERFMPYARYEFFDPTDGFTPMDNLHFVTAGTRWYLRPDARKPWFWTVQYVRVLEEGMKNRVADDVFYVQLQAQF